MKRLFGNYMIVSCIFWFSACSNTQIESVLDDISRDTYEKSVKKRRLENIGDPNYEEPPTYDRYQQQRNEP